MTTTQPVGLLKVGGRASMRVQLQFDRHGDRATQVDEWMNANYRHVLCRAVAQPGLTVSLTVPACVSEGFESWHARLVAAISPLDVAMELVAECLSDLGLEPCQLMSLHATD